MKHIILASTSPRRKELLLQAGLDFEICAPSCEENIPILPPEQYVMELSRIKSQAGARMAGPDAIVIGADTIVCLRDQILGKPKDSEDASAMLHNLSGQTHAVYTGVTITSSDDFSCHSFFEKTDVTFYNVSDDEIRDYIRSGEPMDKAGAYGIQGRGVFLVQKINGDYNNVVGLPVAHLIRTLKELYPELLS